jgi:acetyltransferase-like isoleucine patch superfamily enzyme
MGTTIGEHCYISSGAHIDVRRGRVIIGNKVSIAGGSYILGHTGHQPLKEGQVTRLEDRVRVFVNAVILPGITVGQNSIVGAGAVVARDVPPNVLVMGNPARVVQHLEKRGTPATTISIAPEPAAALAAMEEQERKA